MYTIRAPRKPEANPKGIPIKIKITKPNKINSDIVPRSIYFKSFAGS